MKKILKRLWLGFLFLFAGLIIVLLTNNLVNRAIYSRLVTDAEELTEEEILQVKEVYMYLNLHGENILPGFHGRDIDLIIYNEAYEFLICTQRTDSEWVFLEYNKMLEKNIYRKNVDNPQAFAVYTNDRWTGSMATKAHFTKSIITSLGDAGLFGYLIPPQVFVTDKEHYMSLIIHEMTHALQGKRAEARLISNQTIHNVNSTYEDNAIFFELIKEEAKYIELAMKSENNEDTLSYTEKFLQTRKKRREECGLSSDEISKEKEFEWLEGLARYAEYASSSRSKALIRKNLTNIEAKMSEGGDEKYYALGMAEAMVLDKLVRNWKPEVFEDGFTLEGALEKALGANNINR
jgi:hypothetical protein